MSYTTLYTVDTQGIVHPYREYRNAFRAAWLVWDMLAQLHLGKKAIDIQIENGMNDSSLQPVWDLWKDKSIPESHRIVLMTTFDLVVVRAKNLNRLVTAYQNYADTVTDAGHILTMATDLQNMGDDCLAVCWHQTSVTRSPWQVQLTCPECGQEIDDWRPYDINRDTGHWFLFDALEEREQ